MPRSHPRSHSASSAHEIAAQLMDLVVGVTRMARTDHAGQALPYAQHAVLKRLEKGGPATTADLARAQLITPQAMGGLVAALEEAGCVARREDATDARRRLVALTAAGRKVLAANRAARHQWLGDLVAARFDAKDQRSISDALALLSKLLPPAPQDP